MRCELTAGTEDLVNVRADNALVDKRVKAGLSRDTTALHAPKGGGLTSQEGGGDERKNLLGIHGFCFASNA